MIRVWYKRPTIILILLMIIVFILQNTFDLESLAFRPSLISKTPWTIVTSIFLHADVSHIFFNMFALFFFGLYLENFVSTRDYLIIFLLSGIIGNIGYMITTTNPNIPVVGASGGIYGIMGCLAMIRPFAVVYIYFVPVPLIMAAGLWALTEALGLFTPSNIAHGSHLLGLIVGVMFGLYFRNQFNQKRVKIIMRFARG